MVRKANERFTQSVGNYAIVANSEISEKEEYFIEVINRAASLAYTINDMVRFFGDTLDRVENDVTNTEWSDFAKRVNRINYKLQECESILSDVYNDLENR